MKGWIKGSISLAVIGLIGIFFFGNIITASFSAKKLKLSSYPQEWGNNFDYNCAYLTAD